MKNRKMNIRNDEMDIVSLSTDLCKRKFSIYQQNNNKIVIMAVGSSNECAEQMVKIFKKHPNLRAHSGMSKMVRAPKTKFLLNGCWDGRMDFSRQLMETQGHGNYEYIDPQLIPSLFLT